MIPFAVKNFAHLFYVVSKILECGKLNLFLLTDEIQTDKKEYLQSLETTRDLRSLHRWTDTKKCLSVLTHKDNGISILIFSIHIDYVSIDFFTAKSWGNYF